MTELQLFKADMGEVFFVHHISTQGNLDVDAYTTEFRISHAQTTELLLKHVWDVDNDIAMVGE